jgi:hypothetical protein
MKLPAGVGVFLASAKTCFGCTVSSAGRMTVAHPSKYFSSTLKKSK